jgi:hypothetical protein
LPVIGSCRKTVHDPGIASVVEQNAIGGIAAVDQAVVALRSVLRGTLLSDDEIGRKPNATRASWAATPLARLEQR